MESVEMAKRKRKTDSPVIVVPTACGKCGSTKKTYVGGYRHVEFAGEMNGFKYLKQILKWAVCSNCSQRRLERVLENDGSDPSWVNLDGKDNGENLTTT